MQEPIPVIIKNQWYKGKLQEKIANVFPSDIENLNREGWSIIQVIHLNTVNECTPKKIKIEYPEDFNTTGYPLDREEYSYVCLLRKVDN